MAKFFSSLFVKALVKPSHERVDADDGEDEPEDQTDEQDVEDTGRAPTRALTTTFMPSIFAMARKGLRALKVRIVLKMGMLPAPNRLAPKLMSETDTMTKSSQHHALPKYMTQPMANSLSVVSRKKTTVKIRSR